MESTSKAEITSCFHISVIGQLESAYFPLGPDGSNIFCHYEIVAGADWELISGLKSGITQCATASSSSREIVFNMPIEFTYKATNPFGWPQIVVSVYGKNFWGTEIVLGYSRVHVPLVTSQTRKITIPIISPKCTTLLAGIASWITGRNPELRDPKVLCDGTKNKGLQAESYGEINIQLSTISRGLNKLGYEWGRQSSK